MQTTVAILAAGIGKRYGGLKQLAPVDDYGNLLIDYSLYDARRAGFTRALFIINKEIAPLFRELVGDRIARRMEVDYAYQELCDLPAGFSPPAGRTQPFGTGHALLCCKNMLHEPFAVINADDFYGSEAFTTMMADLRAPQKASSCALLGYRLGDTLSHAGGVTRGVCVTDANGSLLRIDETKNIHPCAAGGGKAETADSTLFLPASTTVSMNFWGFTPDIFSALQEDFPAFLENALPNNPLHCEYILPTAVCALLQSGRMRARVLPVAGKWIGMTYREDMPIVRKEIRALTDAGLYPPNLLD